MASEKGWPWRALLLLDEPTNAYGDLTLVKGPTRLVAREDRLGIIGPNGSGKTMLLKPDKGHIEFGPAVVVG